MSSRSEAVEADIQSALNDPALKAQAMPGVGTAEDVAKMYHGGGTGSARPVSVPAPDRSGQEDAISSASNYLLSEQDDRKQDSRAKLEAPLPRPKSD